MQKESRIGDALLFAYKLKKPAGKQAERRFASVLQLTLGRLIALPYYIATAARHTALSTYQIEFRAGMHFGQMHVGHLTPCVPDTRHCLSPTELASYDLDVVTKVANLSQWVRSGKPFYPALSKAALDLITAGAGSQGWKHCPVAVLEEDYKSITGRLYSAAAHSEVYSVVDFSVFDDDILTAIRNGANHLHMAGWLVGAHDAAFGALLRRSIADNLDLRLARFPDALLTRSRIVSRKEALVGQPFTFGRSRHFLVGESMRGPTASRMFKTLTALWHSGGVLATAAETDRTLRQLAKLAAGGRTPLRASDITVAWLMKLTGLTRESCANRIMTTGWACPLWAQKLVKFVNSSP